MLRPLCWIVLATLGALPSVAQPAAPVALGEALRAAIGPALPFPDARRDGTPVGGATEPVWTVRWSEADGARVEVLANPLNPDNRERALKAEAEIQKAVMASQRQSQADYEQAVSDFQRTGKVGEIREVSLSDEGVAGERYDAESQLTIRAETFEGSHQLTVATARRPEAWAGSGEPIVVRVAAHTYQEPGVPGEPGMIHFSPEQAWVYFGVQAPLTIAAPDGAAATVSATMAPGAPRGVVVSISGNAGLVDRVLRQSDWERFRARVAG